MSARQTDPDWVVLRWQEGPTSHGKATWWHGYQETAGDLRPVWTEKPERGRKFSRPEAERLAEDWNSYAVTKGRPERYRAEPAEQEDGQ